MAKTFVSLLGEARTLRRTRGKPKHAGGAPKVLDGELVQVSVKLDAPSLAALEELCALEDGARDGGVGARSRVIRRAVAHELARVQGRAK